MKHIESLSNYFNHVLTFEEKKYFIELLSDTKDTKMKIKDDCINDLESLHEHSGSMIKEVDKVEEDFPTLSRRIIKYATVRKKLLIQKPKKLNKLKNAIKQIGGAEGGFSELTINNIVESLVQEKILNIHTSDDIEWLR